MAKTFFSILIGFKGFPIVSELLAADLFSLGATKMTYAISLSDFAS